MKEIFNKFGRIGSGEKGTGYTWFGIKYELLIRLALSVILFCVGLIASAKGKLGLLFMLLSFLISGYDVILRAITQAANERRIGEEMVITIAAVLAFVINAGYEAAAVMIIYQAGFAMRAYALELTRGSLRDRIDPYPADVTVLKDENKVLIPAEEIQVDDIIVVQPGERFQVDSEVTMGSSMVDLSAVLGRAREEEFREGQTIPAGAVNETDELRVRAVKTWNDSAFSKAVAAADDGNSIPSASESSLERYADVFAPFALGIGILIALLLLIFTDANTETAIHKALVFLIVACPAALMVPIPFTYLSGLYRSLQKGVLVKNSAILDAVARIGAVIFDKDDLLANDEYRVVAVKSDKLDPNVLLKVAAHAASGSKKSAAVSIVNAYEGIIDSSLVKRFEEFEDGLAAEIDDVIITMGTRDAMTRLGVEIPEEEIDPMTVYLALNGRFAGCIQLTETVRTESRASISEIESTGCDCVMLSADNAENTKTIASSVGIREYFSQCMPMDRLERIQEVKERFPTSTVLFIGDSSDASSLDAADVGVCLNGIYDEAAMKAGEIVVMDRCADPLADAVETARITRKTARQILFGILGVKALLLVLSIFGVTYQLWFAAMVDVLVGVAGILYSTFVWADK